MWEQRGGRAKGIGDKTGRMYLGHLANSQCKGAAGEEKGRGHGGQLPLPPLAPPMFAGGTREKNMSNGHKVIVSK